MGVELLDRWATPVEQGHRPVVPQLRGTRRQRAVFRGRARTARRGPRPSAPASRSMSARGRPDTSTARPSRRRRRSRAMLSAGPGNVPPIPVSRTVPSADVDLGDAPARCPRPGRRRRRAVTSRQDPAAVRAEAPRPGRPADPGPSARGRVGPVRGDVRTQGPGLLPGDEQHGVRRRRARRRQPSQSGDGDGARLGAGSRDRPAHATTRAGQEQDPAAAGQVHPTDRRRTRPPLRPPCSASAASSPSWVSGVSARRKASAASRNDRSSEPAVAESAASRFASATSDACSAPRARRPPAGSAPRARRRPARRRAPPPARGQPPRPAPGRAPRGRPRCWAARQLGVGPCPGGVEELAARAA